MTVSGLGMSGGSGGPSGAALLLRLIAIIVPVGVVVQVSVNAMSRIADSAALGRPISPAVAWGTELTSGAAILLLLPAIWFAVGRLQPARLGWPLTIAVHVLASVAFSLIHVGLMTAMRLALWGVDYAWDPTLATLVYEYRKDCWTYALIALFFALARWMTSSALKGETVTAEAPRILLVQDGNRRHHVPVDAIDHIEAAGNYVELAADGRRLLHRATLSSIEAELGETFVRIHRSRLVNRAAIRSIETNASGDFEVETATGAVLKGSRRFRDALPHGE